jgi:hypothetical protein
MTELAIPSLLYFLLTILTIMIENIAPISLGSSGFAP